MCWEDQTQGVWQFCSQKITREMYFCFTIPFIVTAFAFTITTNLLKHLWVAPTTYFPSDLELMAQLHAALSDITDVVGKYGFADAELIWQVNITEFHCQQCCSLWESIHCELWYLTVKLPPLEHWSPAWSKKTVLSSVLYWNRKSIIKSFIYTLLYLLN